MTVCYNKFSLWSSAFFYFFFVFSDEQIIQEMYVGDARNLLINYQIHLVTNNIAVILQTGND